MIELEWTQTAKNDLHTVIEFIASDNISAAQHLKNTIDNHLKYLALFPNMSREGRVPGTREKVIAKHYIIVYSLNSEQNNLTILRLLSTYQQWPNDTAPQ